MSVILEGKNRFIDDLEGKKEAASLAAFNIVTKGRLIVATRARKLFRAFPGGRKVSQLSGKTYYVFIPPYEATPPTPTNRSGLLAKSIVGGPVVKYGVSGWAGQVGTVVYYAGYVEFGTKFMVKEPFLQTGLRDSAEDIQALAEAEWEKAWSGGV